MRIRGSLLRFLALFCFLVAFAHAGVVARLTENPILKGEEAELTLEAVGKRVRFPAIEKIGPYRVRDEGVQRLERMEGNATVVRWLKILTFTPQRSVEIPTFEVEVDDKKERTNPLRLRVLSAAVTKEPPFRLDISVSRQTAYVGEMIDATVRFSERKEVPVMNVDFLPLQYDNFWVKRVYKKRVYPEAGYLVHEMHYLFFPQRPGKLTIGPAKVKVAVTKRVRDAFGFIVSRPKWVTIASDSVPIRVKPLPAGVDLVGQFSLEAEAAPRRVRAGEPVTLEVRVKAEGNIEDFSMPPLHIEGVTIYPDKPVVEQSYSHGVYRGEWRRRYVLIANRSYTVPPFSLRYLDPENGRVETVKTRPIPIKVEAAVAGSVQGKGVNGPEEDQEGKEMEKTVLFGVAAGAFFAGMAFMAGLMRLLAKRRLPKTKEGGEPRNEAQMLQALMPHIADSKEAAQMAENLYASIYEGRSLHVGKKEFAGLMKRLESRKVREVPSKE
ncbi:BatD family protein [Hydrogenimonas sp. SS33]|uniref:BatD family protein n=1 Tax=Hydrogenimonas leucolamina TaxID=2954236 RepID=UPI00336BBFBB